MAKYLRHSGVLEHFFRLWFIFGMMTCSCRDANLKVVPRPLAKL